MYIKFLGTGTSYGVPVLGCNCKTCSSEDPKNIRFRSSLYIAGKNNSLLIDTPPEMRLQLLKNDIKQIDTILYTHPHADHIMGFDDIRILNKILNKSIPCYGNEYTIKNIKRTFNYIFNSDQIGGGIPEVELHIINSKFKIGNLKIIPLPIKHGKLSILGYKINDIAYITDCSKVPVSTKNKIKNIKILIINALRYKPHFTHMNVKQAVNVIKELEPERAFLTHISHDLEHVQTEKKLPENIKLAYDNLRVEV